MTSSDISVEVRRIEHGATWTVTEDAVVVASGIECCESCAMRAAARKVRALASSREEAS